MLLHLLMLSLINYILLVLDVVRVVWSERVLSPSPLHQLFRFSLRKHSLEFGDVGVFHLEAPHGMSQLVMEHQLGGQFPHLLLLIMVVLHLL
mmetsp:Transcript_8129/g.7568  ORF Transcript_8129/g.7568 Transcript_8129/m.7568 type:complete len:92 (-) Transcript_8129:272-547(-)